MQKRSKVISLACVGVCGLLYSSQRAMANDQIVFNSVGVLDPNAAASANPSGLNSITITDATTNNTVSGLFIGKNFNQFNSIITTAFANNTGGVCNFGDGGTIVSGVAANTAFGVNSSNTAAVNYGTTEANILRFYRTDFQSATQAIDWNTTNAGLLASGANGGDYLGIQGTSNFGLTFVNPLSDFGITLLPRSDAGSRTCTLSFQLSNGSVESTSQGSVGNSNLSVFFGIEAPAGLSIVSMSAAVSGASRFDDLAFVVAPPVVAGANIYWTNSQATGSWVGTNWSNNGDGSGTAVSLPTNGSTGITFTASSVGTGAVNTVLGASQNVSSISVNTSSSSVTIGGTNDLTIGVGGISLASTTPLTINTSGKVNLGISQAWNAGTSTLTVASQVSGASGLTILGPSGTVVLSGPNTFTGGIVVQGGNLVLGNATALGGPTASLVINLGSVDLKNLNTTLASLSGNTGSVGGVLTSSTTGLTTITIAGTVGTPSAFLGTIQNGGGTVAVNVSSNGILTMQSLAGTTGSTYSGGTTVASGGSLNVGVGSGNSNGADNTLGTGALTLGSATTPVATVNFKTQAPSGASIHTFPNAVVIAGNTTIQNQDGTNIFTGSISINGSNNTLGLAQPLKPFEFAGPLSGSGGLTLQGIAFSGAGTNGGGYVVIGSSTTPVDNTGFTGTITVNNTVTTSNSRGAQIVAAQNALLPNGTIAFTADLPVAGQGASGFATSAISFASGVTAPQIGALSSSTGGAIALVTAASESVNLTLGLNNSTGSTYGGNLSDGGSGTPGSLTKINSSQQILTGSNTYLGGTNATDGSLVFASPTAFPIFTNLTIGANASAGAANFGTGPKNTLFASGLSIAGISGAWTGKLDLANNDMVVQNGVLSTLTNQVAQGFHNGTWNSSGGIVSTAAASDTTHLHALGVIQNSATGAPGGTELYSVGTSNAFDGATADASTDVLVKYTYYGDANLDGKVDGSDYTRIDNGSLHHLTGWFNGDFNYDSVVNGSDYTLIDNAFNTQGAAISAEVASPTAQIAPSSAVPEPTAIGVLGVALLGGLSRRRRSVQ